MSDKNSLLIAGLYATIGLLVVGIGLGTFAYYQSLSESAVARMETNLAAEMAATNHLANTRPPRPLANTAALTRAHAQLNELQTRLERNSRTLKKRSTELNQKTAECKALQEQLDGSIATVLELLDMDTDTDARSAEDRQQLGRDLEQEFNQLKTELERSESLELEHGTDAASRAAENGIGGDGVGNRDDSRTDQCRIVVVGRTTAVIGCHLAPCIQAARRSGGPGPG